MPEKNGSKYKAFFITQETIDRLISNFEMQDGVVLEDVDAFDESNETGLISQSDIDQLLNPSLSDDDGFPDELEAAEEDEEPGLISQDDIDRLLGDSASEEEVSSDELKAAEEDEEPSLISQDDIDRLLDASASQDKVTSDEPEAAEEDEEPSLISQDDIDRLLDASASQDKVTSDELEAAEEGEEPSLISQDDIDRLFGASTSQDEVSSDELEAAEEDEEPSLISPENVDQDAADQVVLEDEDTQEDVFVNDIIDDETSKKKTWYANRLFQICSALLLIVGVSSFFVYLYWGTACNPSLEPPASSPVLTFQIVQQQEAIAKKKEPDKPYVSAVMKGFFIPASLTVKGVSYLEADLSMDLASARIADEIKKHEPFFRSIVYDILDKALTAKEKGAINEADLEKAIQDALNRALPEKGIEKIVFTKFSVI